MSIFIRTSKYAVSDLPVGLFSLHLPNLVYIGVIKDICPYPWINFCNILPFLKITTFSEISTVLPAKRDSDSMFCLQVIYRKW